jgi:thioesterase domain-containing protein/acyl carrier protein
MQSGDDRADLLLGIWRRVLRIDDVDLDSNFFDLGGDSLLAITLFLEIERATGMALPITAIYDAQTVGEQVELLHGDRADEFSPLVLLKPGDNSAPLFLFHGVGGTVVEYAMLGKLIDIPGEVYAVQAKGVDGTEPPLERMEDMAEFYLAAIREKQPCGPYWLCGYSFGGLTAIEVARRLKHSGEKIALLFLIDSYAHPSTWPRISQLKVRLRRMVRRVLARTKAPLRENLALFLSLAGKQRAAQNIAEDSSDALPPEMRKRSWLLKTKPNLPLPLLQTRLATERALYRYQPSSYSGSAIFLKARRADSQFPHDPRRVWRKRIAHLKVEVCPGSHLTMVSDHAPEIAARINASIRAARPSSSSGAARPMKIGPLLSARPI